MKVIITRASDPEHRHKRVVVDWPSVPREGDSIVIKDVCYDVVAVLWDADRDEVEVRIR